MTDIYARQAAIEEQSIVYGGARYTRTREERGESETRPGKEQTKRAIDALAAAIEAWVLGATKSAGRWHTAAKYLAHIHPQQAAYLTIRYALDAAGENQKFATASLRVGSAIEDHVNLMHMSAKAPGLYSKVINQVRLSTAEHHRVTVLRHVVRKFDMAALSWSDKDKLIIGAKLIELFDETCGLVTEQTNTEGHHNRQTRIVFTPAAAEWMAKAHAAEMLRSPVHQPMVCPPRDWKDPYTGGYISGSLRRATLMQTRVAGAELMGAIEQMRMVYDAVNAIQRTPWRINKGVLAVMTEAKESGERLQALLAEPDRALPARPADLPPQGTKLTAEQKETLMLYKRQCAEVYTRNARLHTQRVAALSKVATAASFADEQAIYFPHYLDFRGRIYPYASYLNPQSDDVGRALLEFAEGKPLGERGLFWLKVHVANLFGIDKVSFEDRVAWVDANMERLLRYAAAPLDDLSWAFGDGAADSPWCALAACMELAGAMVQGEDYVSHLPIAMDGSCSGLQHYSAMLRDPKGGASVNLVPAEKPGDIYTAVAQRAQALIDASLEEGATPWKGGKVVRKIAKQPTMTMCYSATLFGMQSQIANAVEKLGGEDYLMGYDVRQASVYAAGVVWDAIGDTVVAAKEGMAFLKACAKLANEAGQPIRWTAPNGFIVRQGYTDYMSRRNNVHYKGLRLRLTLAVDTKTLDHKRQVAGVAPNFVHSLDSSHLMATVTLGEDNGLKHWACIHDSFGTHAADVDLLHRCIREAFIEQYTPCVLERFREEIVAQLPPELAAKVPPVPAKGALDLDAVRDSAYFFA